MCPRSSTFSSPCPRPAKTRGWRSAAGSPGSTPNRASASGGTTRRSRRHSETRSSTTSRGHGGPSRSSATAPRSSRACAISSASGFFSSAMGWKDLRYEGNVFNPGLAGMPRGGDAEARRQSRADGHAHQGRMTERLGIGFVGSGFITRFHVQSFVGVREADVRGVWSPHRDSARAGGAARARSRRRRLPRVRVDRRHGRGPRHRRDLDLRSEPRARRERRGSGARDRDGARHASRTGVREAARAQPRRGDPGPRPRRARRAQDGVSRGSALHATRRGWTLAALGARRRDDGTSVPRARGRRAQRAAYAVVLAGRPAGRRCPQRHDVPLGAARAAPPHAAGRAALHRAPREGHRQDRQLEVVASRPTPSGCSRRWARRSTILVARRRTSRA